MTAERHLILRELILLPSGEWLPRHHGWFMIRVAEGAGYCLPPQEVRELNPGDCLVGVFNGKTLLRASQLGSWKLQYFLVDPQLISGLLTMLEVSQLDAVAGNPAASLTVFPAREKIAQEFARIGQPDGCGELRTRCRLLCLWAEALAGRLSAPAAEPAATVGLHARLRQLVGQISEAELLSCSVGDLAGQLHCSQRHFGRLFRQTFGVSFRQRQIELRLLRARHLLTSSHAKIINVAYDSGYRHLGLFNTMFKKRFGLTPSEWRRNAQKNNPTDERRPSKRIRAVALLAGLAGLLLASTAPAQTKVPPELAPPGSQFGVEVSAGEMAKARAALHQKLLELDVQAQHGQTNPPATTATTNATFAVTSYEVAGNTRLPVDLVEAVLAPYTGPAVSFETIRQALRELQVAYRERGYVTVSVSLPPQKLTNSVVKVQVIEGRLAEINVVNNRYFSSNNIMRALPSLRTNWILNSLVLQRELDAANANRDRQIFPKIGPGPEPGTSTLDLKVKDRLPLHTRVELNNQSTPGTPDLRGNLSAQYNNLWDRDHQLGVQYAFTPETYKGQTRNAATSLDDPLVANYSGYYRFPLGGPVATTDAPDGRPAQFGYNEATHSFQLPPASGRPELTFFGSRSTVDTGIKLSPAQQSVTGSATNTTSILKQDSSQDLTLNENLGFRLAVPLPEENGVRGAFSCGLDFKRYRKASFSTNNFAINYTVIDPKTGVIIAQISTNYALPSPASYNAVDYLPLNLGLDCSIPDRLGVSFYNVALNFNFLPVFLGDKAFSQAATSPQAGAKYAALTAGYSRDQKIFKDWDVLLRANGQLSNQPLISNEQFALGGLASVRGYREGEVYGDSGWRVSVEPRTPFLSLGTIENNHHSTPLWVRASTFLDYGEAYTKNAPAGVRSLVRLCGAGIGATASLGDFLDARLMVAWPILNSPITKAGAPGVFFGIGAQF